MRVIASVLLVFLVGCANVGRYESALQTATPLASSLSELEFVPVDLRKADRFDLGPRSGVFEFSTGKSFYRAYRLPEQLDGLEVLVESKFSTSAGATAHFARVQAKILDGTFQVLQIVDDVPTFRETMIEGWRMVMTFSPPAEARYVVLYVNPVHVGQRYPWRWAGGVAVAGAGAYSVSSDTTVPAGPGGPMLVTFREPQ